LKKFFFELIFKKTIGIVFDKDNASFLEKLFLYRDMLDNLSGKIDWIEVLGKDASFISVDVLEEAFMVN
tara:strand:+ start:5635 stop:5841 length:207 start_codon:yes stop_codon:yes gene_type:complete